jgi:hypothetical protein
MAEGRKVLCDCVSGTQGHKGDRTAPTYCSAIQPVVRRPHEVPVTFPATENDKLICKI